MPGIILDARADAKFAQCLHIIAGTLFKAFLFQQLSFFFKIVQAVFELFLDRSGCAVDDILARRVAAGRIDDIDRIGIEHFAGERIDFADTFDLIVKQLDAQDIGIGMAQRDLDHIAARAEGPAAQFHIIARILLSDQPAHQILAVDDVTDPDGKEHVAILIRIAGAVDAGDRSDDDRVPPFQDGVDRCHPEHIQLDVGRRDSRALRIGLRQICLWLIIIEIGDKIFHAVVREELLEFRIQLAGERLIVRKDQRRLVHLRDHIGDRKGLAGTGGAKQHLFLLAAANAFHQP